MKIKNNDILLFKNGRMAQVIEVSASIFDMASSTLLFLDEEGYSYKEIEKIELQLNCGQDPAVLVAFYGSRSLHLRLNVLGKV